MRLIDADALSEKLCETTIFIKDGEVFQRMINDAPTVSADARPTGEWIQKDMCADRFCSECNYAVWDSEAEEYNFCPNCGTKMYKDGEDE